MRLLALRPQGRVLPSIHEFMVKAFKNLGTEVHNTPLPAQNDEFLSWASRLQGKYRAIFTINLGGNQKFLKYVKEWQIEHRQIWIIWFVDDPAGYNFPQACDPSYTLAFCWDRGLVQEMKGLCSEWGGYMHYLPLATDPEIFFPETIVHRYHWRGVFVGVVAHLNKLFEKIIASHPNLAEEVDNLWEIYKRDFSVPLVTFLWKRLEQKMPLARGDLQANWLAHLWVKVITYQLAKKKRREVVSKVLDGQDGVFGDKDWLTFLKNYLYHGSIPYGEELRQIYNCASFVLDIRPGQSRTGLTQRIFDASACGVPVLTEWSPELEHLFELKEEIYTFRNLEEAAERRDLIIADMAEAKKKANKIRERIRAEHTYYQRARYILECLQKF